MFKGENDLISPEVSKGDHLFINYASEDFLFVEWLALRLTAEGYKVWCDRFELLGGESYPRDINKAIKTRTFRFIAVLSKHSIDKPDPLKERTFAHSLAKERGEDFIIPLNLDGLSPTQIGWRLSDLTYIPFHLSWADGLRQLLVKLEKVKAPKMEGDGRSVVTSLLNFSDVVQDREERVWASLVRVSELPIDIHRYEAREALRDADGLDILKSWPTFHEGAGVFWSFIDPSHDLAQRYKLESRGSIEDWRNASSPDIKIRDLAVKVINSSLRSLCLARGLVFTADSKHLYFPSGLFENDHLKFRTYTGRKTWASVTGIRSFKTLTETTRIRYHVAPVLRFWLDRLEFPVVFVRMHLFITEEDGTPLSAKAAFRKRKKICKNWWNKQWLSLLLGILQHLADGKGKVAIGKEERQRFVMDSEPMYFSVPLAIDESKLKRGLDEGPEDYEPEEDFVREPIEEEEDEGKEPEDQIEQSE